jgi:hypothetical protein
MTKLERAALDEAIHQMTHGLRELSRMVDPANPIDPTTAAKECQRKILLGISWLSAVRDSDGE